MSVQEIRAALESALDGLSPTLSTAWENMTFRATEGTPYQRCHLLLAEPDNETYGGEYFDQGIFQVTLCYPLKGGTGSISARIDQIRSTFTRGASFTSGASTVVIQRTPHVGPAIVDGPDYTVPIKIRFFSHQTT